MNRSEEKTISDLFHNLKLGLILLGLLLSTQGAPAVEQVIHAETLKFVDDDLFQYWQQSANVNFRISYPEPGSFRVNIKSPTQELNRLTLDLSTFKKRQRGGKDLYLKVIRFQSKNPLWASWWYPNSNIDLLTGPNSTLAKVDKMFGLNSAAGFKKHLSDSLSYGVTTAWDGHCKQFSYSSLFFNRPYKSALISFDQLNEVYGGALGANSDHQVCLSPADQKFLMMLSLNKTTSDMWGGLYGQVFSPHKTDEFEQIPTDIYPHEFLKFAQHQMGELNRPFIMDLDPQNAKFNVPVEQVILELSPKTCADFESGPTKDLCTKIETQNQSYVCELNQQGCQNPQLILTGKFKVRYLDYDLASEYMDQDMGFKNEADSTGVGQVHGNKTYEVTLHGFWNREKFEVLISTWQGKARRDHPDYVIAFPENLLTHQLTQRPDNTTPFKVNYDEFLKYRGTGMEDKNLTVDKIDSLLVLAFDPNTPSCDPTENWDNRYSRKYPYELIDSQ